MAKPEFGEITFPTRGAWFAADLRRFLDAIEELYGAFRLARTYSLRRAENYDRRLYPDLDLLEDELLRRRNSPSLSELRRIRSLLENLRTFPGAVTLGGYYGWLAANIDLLDEPGRLRLARVQMASPGKISLEGSGEVIEQAREFVKDLRGRNRQEREMADLSIERERVRLQSDKLALAREYLSTFGYIPPDVLDDLGIRAVRGASSLIELDREEKLELEPGEEGVSGTE